MVNGKGNASKFLLSLIMNIIDKEVSRKKMKSPQESKRNVRSPSDQSRGSGDFHQMNSFTSNTEISLNGVILLNLTS